MLLVDDVVTTGSTICICARELLGSGAEQVFAMALCHAVYSGVSKLTFT